MEKNSQHNVLGWISHVFTTNQSLSILLLIAVVVFGMVSFVLTPKQYNPEITRPAFLITLAYDGATIEQATDRVVYELVEKINTIPGVDDVFTEVADGGAIETTVIFEVGYDTATAKLDIWSQLEQYHFLAQGFIHPPTVYEINPETIPVLQIVFAADVGTPATLRESVMQLTHTLGAVPSVSVLSVHGGYQPQVIIELQPERLAAAGVPIQDITHTVAAAQTRSVAAGMVSGAYRTEQVLAGATDTVAALGALPITPAVRVRDVAQVYEGAPADRSMVWYADGTHQGEVVVMGVSKVEGSSAPVVAEAVLHALDEALTTTQFQHLSYTVVGNDGKTASDEIYGLSTNLLTSIGIVALVLMLFLSVRAALVVLIAIPMTLLIVFGLGWLFGETINRITLFALILSLGLLVDSAIVVVENIYAHLEAWKQNPTTHTRAQVIARAVSEIGVGLVLSTITSVIVFLPMAHITGMMGPYMGPIAFFVPAALLVSLVVAIVITPFIASHILTGGAGKLPVSTWFAARLDALMQLYGRVLKRILASRPTQRLMLRSVLGLFLVSLILPLAALVHFQMLPKADRDQLYLYVDLPVDTSIQHTETVVSTLTDIVHGNEAVTNIQAYIGEPPIVDFNGMFKGAQGRTGTHQATMRVNLTPADTRTESSSAIAQAVRTTLYTEAPQLRAHVRVIEEPPGPPVRATFVAKVAADTQDVQTQVAQSLYATIAGVAGITDRYISTDAPSLRTVHTFDHETAHALGVSMHDAATTLALVSGPITVGEYRASTHTEQVPIVLTVPQSYRDAPSDTANLIVGTQADTRVPLAAVVHTQTESRPSAVTFEDVQSITYVTAEVSDRSIVYAMIEVMRSIAQGDVPGVTMQDWSLFGMSLVHEASGERVTITWGGEWEMTLENFRDLGIAMGVALMLVYGVLVAQYNRFATPAYILVTVPLGLVGILWGFFVLDTTANIYLTATALIGFIALIGLVVNNAIIFLEYVTQSLRAGERFEQALLNAGTARLRPIMLTSLTTVLGSLTIASDPVWSGLAWAIVFGLSLSTILTLVIYPTLLMYYTGHTYTHNQ